MSKKKKITWDDIWQDFKAHYPRLKLQSLYYYPHDYLTIQIWFTDNVRMLYDYSTKRCTVVSR